MLVFFFPFFLENLGSYVYDRMRARVRLIVFERHQRYDFVVEKLNLVVRYARARALAVCMLARAARVGPPATAWLLSEYSEAAPQSGQMSCGR